MDLDSIFSFMYQYSDIYIPVLIGITILISISIVLVNLKNPKSVEGVPDLSDLEGTLKRVLEQTEVKASSVAMPPGMVAPGGGLDTVAFESMNDEERAEFQTTIEQQKNEILQLKSSIETIQQEAAQNSGGSGEMSPEIQSKIEELEAKLAEYEIIEDDIADLSMYKEENAQLKAEIEALRNAGGSSGGEEEITSIEDALAEDGKVEAKQPAEEPADAGEGAVDDDIMAEFAAAVESQKASDPREEAASGFEQKADEAVKEVQEEAKSEENSSSDDEQDSIMAEFAAAVDDQKKVEQGESPAEESQAEEVPSENDGVEASSDPDSKGSGIVDPEQVMAEMASLEEAEADSGDNTLESGLDTDKLVAEAEKMEDQEESS